MADNMDDLKLTFDGLNGQIEANTLINSLLHFTTVTQAVNRGLSSDRKVIVKINALEPGSFIVHLLLETSIIDGIVSLFSKEHIDYVKELVTVVGGVYKAAKFFRGKVPKAIENEGDAAKVTNDAGNVTYIDNRSINIYQNNGEVREALKNEFETLASDENVTGFEISTKTGEVLVDMTNSDFEAVSTSDLIVTDKQSRQLTKESTLTIISLSFEKAATWKFWYDGNKIRAKIRDEEFAKVIDGGEKFAKGDALRAEFEVYQEFNTAANAFVNVSYKINRIIEHIPRAEQARLEL